jgi:hypothetical protein
MLRKRLLLLLPHQKRLYNSLVPTMTRPANADRYSTFVRHKTNRQLIFMNRSAYSTKKSEESLEKEKNKESLGDAKNEGNKKEKKDGQKKDQLSAGEKKDDEVSARKKKSEEKENAQQKVHPPVDVIKKWDSEALCEFLKKQNLKLEDKHLYYFSEKEIIGLNFLQMTKEEFIEVGLPEALAEKISELSKMLKNKEKIAEIFEDKVKSPNELLYIFVDNYNSNILTEGKFSIAEYENLGTFNYDRSSLFFDKLHIDYGRLLATVQGKRKLGSGPIVAGSSPSRADSLWKNVKKQGFRVIAYNDKKIDSAFVYSMSEVILTQNPGILAIITNDNNYDSIITQALKHEWKVEIWGWKSGMKL